MSDLSENDSIESVDDIIEIRPLHPRRSLLPRDFNERGSQSSPESADNISNEIVHRNTQRQSFTAGNRMGQRTKESPVRQDIVMTEHTAQFPPIIPLNVGGVKYMTRLSTLTKYPDSMLAALFSGRHIVDKDEYGNFFLDSNGNLFGHILEYLRNGSIPPNNMAVSVYNEAQYYGIHQLAEKLQLKPDVAMLHVKEAHRAQFPKYESVKNAVIKLAMDKAIHTKIGEVIIHAFKKEFVPRAPHFNPNHGCVAETAQITIGPWESDADEEIFIRCLENDLVEDGFNIRPHDSKRKCRYYHGQTCQKFIYRLQIVFG